MSRKRARSGTPRRRLRRSNVDDSVPNLRCRPLSPTAAQEVEEEAAFGHDNFNRECLHCHPGEEEGRRHRRGGFLWIGAMEPFYPRVRRRNSDLTIIPIPCLLQRWASRTATTKAVRSIPRGDEEHLGIKGYIRGIREMSADERMSACEKGYVNGIGAISAEERRAV